MEAKKGTRDSKVTDRKKQDRIQGGIVHFQILYGLFDFITSNLVLQYVKKQKKLKQPKFIISNVGNDVYKVWL